MQNEMKTIYSLRIRSQLRARGIEPLMEFDNPYKPGLKCWVFEMTDSFNDAFNEIMDKGADYSGK